MSEHDVENETADEPVSDFEEWYESNPFEALGHVIGNAAEEVASQVAAQVQAEAAQARAERATTIMREAAEAMTAAYGDTWAETPALADRLRADAASGRLPDYDARVLAEHFQTHYLAARERAKPSREQVEEAYRERIQKIAAEMPSDFGL
jgi:hypothetical protein